MQQIKRKVAHSPMQGSQHNLEAGDFKGGVLLEESLYFKCLATLVNWRLAYLAYRAKLTPNQITWLGISMAFPAMVFNLSGHYLAAILFFHLFYFLDGADGVLARVTSKTSKLGAYLDEVAHYFFTTAYFVSFAACAYLEGEYPLSFLLLTFFLLSVLVRANVDLILRIGGRETLMFHSPADDELARRIRGILHRSFIYPNILVFLTLAIWSVELVKLYLIYGIFMSSIYYGYSILSAPKRFRKSNL